MTFAFLILLHALTHAATRSTDVEGRKDVSHLTDVIEQAVDIASLLHMSIPCAADDTRP